MDLVEIRCRILQHQNSQKHCPVCAWEIDNSLILRRGVVAWCGAFEAGLCIHIFCPAKEVVSSLVTIDNTDLIDDISERVINWIDPVAIIDLRDGEDKIIGGEVEDYPRVNRVYVRLDDSRTVDRCQTALVIDLIHANVSENSSDPGGEGAQRVCVLWSSSDITLAWPFLGLRRTMTAHEVMSWTPVGVRATSMKLLEELLF